MVIEEEHVMGDGKLLTIRVMGKPFILFGEIRDAVTSELGKSNLPNGRTH